MQFLLKCLENTSILNGIKSRINLKLDFMVQWFNLGHWSFGFSLYYMQQVKMPKAKYMLLNISLAEAKSKLGLNFPY